MASFNLKAFLERAENYGDFVVSFNQKGGSGGSLVATIDPDNAYIQANLPHYAKPLGTVNAEKGSVDVWSWTHNAPRTIYLNRVNQISPLSKMLRNSRSG